LLYEYFLIFWGSDLGGEVRNVVWLGDTLETLRAFPQEVRKEIGVALYDAQSGDKAPSAKPFKGVGSGVFEIAIRFATNAYRAVYAVQIGEHVYVLHVFQKKSKTGIKTPQQDVELIKSRYRQAVKLEQKP
jgi:phage-related protein